MNTATKCKKFLIPNTSNKQKLNHGLANNEENESEKKNEDKNNVIQYYPIGTKSDGKAIYLATNDTIQFTVNNNNCINYIPRKIKKSNNIENEILPQRCVEMSFYKKEQKKSTENEIINHIYHKRVDKNSKYKNIIKVNKILNSELQNKNKIKDETISKKITKNKDSRNKIKIFNERKTTPNKNIFIPKENLKNKTLQKNKASNSLKGIFANFYDGILEEEKMQRSTSLPKPMNLSVGLIKNRSTIIDNNRLRNALKIFEDGKFINSMKNTERKIGLLNAFEKFKRYKSIGKINMLCNKNINLFNNNTITINARDLTTINSKKNFKKNKIENKENGKEASNTLNNINYNYFITEPNKENEIKNDESKFYTISTNSTTRNNNKIIKSFTNNNKKKNFLTIKNNKKEKQKKLLENKKLAPIKISINDPITECKEYSVKNYINSTINTDSLHSYKLLYKDFNNEKPINNLTDFNTININSTKNNMNNFTIIKNKNENYNKKARTIKTSPKNILSGNKGKNVYPLIYIFSENNKNQINTKINPKKFHIRKLLREEHYYIDENGKEKVFQIKHSLINNNGQYYKNLNLKNNPLKNESNNPKNSNKILVNTINNKQNIIKNKLPISEQNIYNSPILYEKIDIQNNKNLHNTAKYLIKNSCQTQPQKSNISDPNSYNNINNNNIYKYKEISTNKDDYSIDNSKSLDNKIVNLKYTTSEKKNALKGNQRYAHIYNYIDNQNNITKNSMGKKIIKDGNDINKNSKVNDSRNYSNHSYYEIKSIKKKKIAKVDKNGNELKEIFINNKVNLYSNQFNNETVNQIVNLDVSEINYGGINNNENTKSNSPNCRIFKYKVMRTISPEYNNNHY